MRRVWDYIGFAVLFAGLGYVILRLLPSNVLLPPALHVVGALCAVSIPVRLLFRVIDKRRSTAAIATGAGRGPDAVLRPPRRKSSYPVRQVKARHAFRSARRAGLKPAMA